VPHLLHIDSSIQGDESVSRQLGARAAAAWQAANPDAGVTYRDIGAHPVPHLTVAAGAAFRLPPESHTPAQATTYALGLELAAEIRDADAVILGLPLYNFGPPSSVKSWLDHIVIPGVTVNYETMEGLLHTPVHVMVARGGGYSEGSPRFGWDHAVPWLAHALSLLGLEPRFIVAELTLAKVNPAMAGLIPMGEASLANAEAEIDALFSPAAV
jgi:FMN-dependent NADH-azoreductase